MTEAQRLSVEIFSGHRTKVQLAEQRVPVSTASNQAYIGQMPTNAKSRQPHSFVARVANAWPTDRWTNVSVLVAASGGPDSTALLRAIARLHGDNTNAVGRLEVAHFNHRWREDASDADQTFVSELAEKLGLRFHLGVSAEPKLTEQAARDERYHFLQQTAEDRGARYIVLAHTAEDQAETVLHRIIRGTGLRGLQGIPPRRRLTEAVTLVRPMLWAYRKDVLGYLNELGQDYQTDSTNHDCKFTRNRIRNELLPHIAQHYNPAVVNSLLRLGTLAAEANDELSGHLRAMAAKCLVAQAKEQFELRRSELLALSDFAQREVIGLLWREQAWPEQSMGFEQWNRVVEAVRQGASLSLPGGVHMSCDDGTVRFVRAAN